MRQAGPEVGSPVRWLDGKSNGPTLAWSWKSPRGIKAVAVVPRGVLGGIAKGVAGVAGLGTGGPRGRCPETLGGIDFGTVAVDVPVGLVGGVGTPETIVALVATGPGLGPVLDSATEPGREPCTTLPRRDLLGAGPSCSVAASSLA